MDDDGDILNTCQCKLGQKLYNAELDKMFVLTVAKGVSFCLQMCRRYIALVHAVKVVNFPIKCAFLQQMRFDNIKQRRES